MNPEDGPDPSLAGALGRAWLDDRPWTLLRDLAAIGNRMAGSDGEARAADLVADAFRSVGVGDVTRQSFEMNQWVRGDSRLELLAPVSREFDALALPYSPAGTVRGELVDVGHGTPAEIESVDLDGRIAVASTTTPEGSRFVHRMEKFAHAVDAGAVGFVFANHVPGQLPPTGALRFNEVADAVAVGVSKETGRWLTEYAVESAANPGGATANESSDETVTAELSVDAETRPGTSQNVVGQVGPDTDEELLLVAHYDAHDIAEGALDNGCGMATVLAAASVLAETDPSLGVRVAAVGCEEVGLLGSEHLAETLATDRVEAVVNVDGAGRHRDLVAMTHGSAATAAAATAVARETDHPLEVDHEPHPFSDQWPFVRAGVPALQLHSDSGERGRGWGHTHADTIDKVDPRNVREHGMLTALLVHELAGRDVPRLDRDDLVQRFREAAYEQGMRAAGLWPDAWQ